MQILILACHLRQLQSPIDPPDHQVQSVQRKTPPARLLRPGASVSTTEPLYSSIDSTSATNLAASSLRYEATTLNTASLKPPMFRMSSRSGACVEPYGWMSMQTSFGERDAQPLLVL